MAGSLEYTCPGMDESCCCISMLHKVLNKHLGYDSFRSGQLEAAVALLDVRDIFIHTYGYGVKEKSVCFLPKGIRQSMGIIISPLNGLMEQQAIYFCYNQDYAH